MLAENKKYVDYIVEQGVEGEWTYRKWNSGAAECWYRGSVQFSGISGTGVEGLSLGSVNLITPIVFADNPFCIASCDWNYTEWVQAHPNSTSEICIRKFGNGNSFSVTNSLISIYVKGRWK